MSVRFATKKETSHWNESIAESMTSGFFQVTPLAAVKAHSGWTPRYVVASEFHLLILEKSLPFFGKIWYAMQAPEPVEGTNLAGFVKELREFARKNGVFVIKMEPYLLDTPSIRQRLEVAGLVKDTSVQPTFSTVWLDIADSHEAVVAKFSSKTRYNIRKAAQAGVTCRVAPANEQTYRTMYDLFTSTADGRFVIRPYEYYQHFWDAYCQANEGMIVFAYKDDKLLAADFVIIVGDRASRKDAASSPDKTIRGASALVVSETIRELKKRGVTRYDLCNTPHSSRIDDQSDPLYGVGKFKTGFSTDVVDYVGTYRLEIKPWAATLWHRIVERIVRRLHFRRHHQSWY